MKIVTKTVTLEDKTEPLTAIPIGDVHVGSKNFDRKYFEDTINWIASKPNVYVIGMGDYCEFIPPTDPRFDFDSVDPDFMTSETSMTQINYLKKWFGKIKDRILILIPGNHEEKFRRYNYIDPLLELCRHTNTHPGDMMPYLRVKFDKSQFHTSNIIFWLHHGWFHSRKRGAQVNNLEDIANGYEADIYLAGHSHNLFTVTRNYISISGNSLVVNKRIFGNTGTFLKTVSLQGTSYAEQKAYLPAKVGCLRIDIYPRRTGKPDIHVRE